VYRYFRTHAFDIIHLHEPFIPILPYYIAWATCGVPKIATFHAYSEQSTKALLLGRAIFSPLILPLIHRAIAVSAPAERHARINWKRPMSIIPNGIRLRRFESQFSFAPSVVVRLLFVGRRSDERKGFRFLLDAVRHLLARGLPITLDVIGDGNLKPTTAESGVVYHGRLSEPELDRWYQACDILIAPSTGSESFGLVLLEAMSAGIPVICSNIDGYRQLANPQGCILFEPADVGALAHAIESLVFQPMKRQAMGKSNRDYAQIFDWKQLSPIVRNEYLHVIFGRERGLVSHRDNQPKHETSLTIWNPVMAQSQHAERTVQEGERQTCANGLRSIEHPGEQPWTFSPECSVGDNAPSQRCKKEGK
jgi:phosphatidylinositol alpha-mannosyltransferase